MVLFLSHMVKLSNDIGLLTVDCVKQEQMQNIPYHWDAKE